MDSDELRPSSSPSDKEHWTGLPKSARWVFLFVLAAGLVFDFAVGIDSEPVTPTGGSVTTTTWIAPPPPVTQPAPVGVVVYPGESIQKAVDANPPGTRFTIRAGVHSRQSVSPKDGNVFSGEPGAVLDGDGVAEFAFKSYANDVVIEGLVIENYNPPDRKAVIGSSSDDWVLQDSEIRHNNGVAVSSGGTGWRILRNFIHHNDKLGLWGQGDNMLVEGNEIAFNNYLKKNDPSVHAGGTKWANTVNLVVRNNYSHDNHGPGLWTDGNNDKVVYEGNWTVNNYHAGIKHEISCSAVIRNNVVENNGFGASGWLDGAGILVVNSPNVEVYGNTVRNNNDGIGGINANRKTGTNKVCPKELRNFNVHDNTIVMGVGHTGVVGDGSGLYSNWGNHFDRNTYSLGSNSEYYKWDGNLTTSGWKNAGQDPNGTWTEEGQDPTKPGLRHRWR